MKKSLFSISAATLLAVTSIPAKALDDGLVYVAVPPCRIVDTRIAGGGITADTSRDFLASGTSSELAAQGGTDNCENPRAGSEPLAISAYVLATGGSTKNGVLTAFPAGDPDPAPGAGSTLNFAKGQIIGNTTTITLGSASQFAVLARNTDQNVVVDVQGYFYPASGSCSDDMVAAGSVCVDKYEASVVEINGVFTAQSVENVIPTASVTWYEAVTYCANAGKRLPTTAEWQMAAAGTPGGSDCNLNSTAADLTGIAYPTCESTAGAFDMVGNLWEWVADLDNSGGFPQTTTDNTDARALGDSWASTANGSDGTTKAMWIIDPTAVSSRRGFRCAR